jgi:formate dehydrogenase beta subunit
MAHIYEVASFYHHFILCEEPPKPMMRVCESLSCALHLPLAFDESKYNIVKSPCLGLCDKAPAAFEGAFIAPKQSVILPEFTHYQALKHGEISAESIIEKLETAGLKGLGGAGFPTFKKWQIVRQQQGPRYLVVNADEGEVGTFKDKYLLENHLAAVLEGVLIAAEVIKAEAIYIYLRDEYPLARERLKAALTTLNRPDIHLRRGAGAYICGEESALIESLEGKRGYPRLRPPFVGQRGLFNRPTLVNNVETLFWVTQVLEDKPLLRHFSVSGRVKNPGIYQAKAGISARELITLAGGMREGHALQAFLPGGASGGILPASLQNEPLDFGVLAKHGAFIGSHAFIVLSHLDDVREAAKNLMHFFKTESCGQCTPCREGTGVALQLMEEGFDAKKLHPLANVMMEASICGLGQAAPNLFLSVLRHF